MYIVLDISRSYHALERKRIKYVKNYREPCTVYPHNVPSVMKPLMRESRGWIQIQTSYITAKKQKYLSDPLPNPWRKT